MPAYIVGSGLYGNTQDYGLDAYCKIRSLWEIDKYLHETIKIMKPFKFLCPQL